ncbi:MAG: DEAD/DEAH box helicase [Sedimentisphaerales bacterium]|nr:DEAD/DEAH box helicase [Sedimentisphaerales bacterium]
MASKKTFKELGLSAKVLEAINSKGFEEPTEIQAMTIPVMLRNDTNIIAQAQTGTGKTAAFGLPLIEMIDPYASGVQALILVPTRELAIQVSEEITSLRGDKDITTAPIYGGQSIDQQLRRLKKGVHIVVGTPGRVIDHLHRKTLKLGGVAHLILDEADEMLNMGFIEDMEEIMEHTNPNKKTLLFSATMPNRIKDLAHKYMDDYELLAAKKEQVITNLTEHIYFEVKGSDRFEALCRIIDFEGDFYGLVFCRTRSEVDEIARHLTDIGYDAESIHGDISQVQREKTLDSFKKKKVNILVATDVAARGIDVVNLTHVINYSLPQDPEAYVHRIGRTGRAGNEGTAITFITPSEYKRLMFIQRLAKADIKKSKLPRVQDIIQAKEKKIHDDIAAILEGEIDGKYYNIVKKLATEHHPTKVMAAIINYCFEDELNPDTYGEIKEFGDRGRPLDQQGTTRLFVALGKKDKMNARKLVDLIRGRTSVKPKHISDIQMMDKFSFVTVPFEYAEEIIGSFKGEGKRKALITHVKNAQGGKKGKKNKK